MKRIALTLTGTVLSLGLGIDTDPGVQEFQFLPRLEHPAPVSSSDARDDFAKHNEVLQEFCLRCHGDVVQKAEMSLKNFDVGAADGNAELAEKMIRKLRAGMMPPAGEPRPDEEILKALVVAVEEQVDGVALPNPDPGYRSFQRLNRAEYRASILELLALDVDASEFLPLDTKSANFDNIADAQPLSATLLEAYLSAADEVARLAVGDQNAPVKSKTFTNIGFVSQWERVEGAPRGTRGGVSAMFNFPADGEYVFEMAFEHTTTGGFTGSGAPRQDIDLSIDGARIALIHVDRYMSVSQPNGAYMWTDPIFVKAGPRRVTAAFIRMYDGPLDDPLSPFEWSLVTRGGGGSAMTVLPHIKDLVIKGPFNPTGVSETPSRKEIFSRRPISPDEERADDSNENVLAVFVRLVEGLDPSFGLGGGALDGVTFEWGGHSHRFTHFHMGYVGKDCE